VYSFQLRARSRETEECLKYSPGVETDVTAVAMPCWSMNLSVPSGVHLGKGIPVAPQIPGSAVPTRTLGEECGGVYQSGTEVCISTVSRCSSSYPMESSRIFAEIQSWITQNETESALW
jgi:hypothetical protein